MGTKQATSGDSGVTDHERVTAAQDAALHLAVEKMQLIAAGNSTAAKFEALAAAATEVERLLRAAITPMPSTDLKAEALAACDRVRKALVQ